MNSPGYSTSALLIIVRCNEAIIEKFNITTYRTRVISQASNYQNRLMIVAALSMQKNCYLIIFTAKIKKSDRYGFSYLSFQETISVLVFNSFKLYTECFKKWKLKL